MDRDEEIDCLRAEIKNLKGENNHLISLSNDRVGLNPYDSSVKTVE